MLPTASPSLLPCSDYTEVAPAMQHQAASLVPSFLHRHNPFRFSTTDLTLCENLSPSSKLFHLSPSFSFKNVLRVTFNFISVLWNVTSSHQTNPVALLFLYAICKCTHTQNLWDSKYLYISLSYKIVNMKVKT